MAITIEEMKEMIVDNEIDYIKNMIKKIVILKSYLNLFM